MCCIEVENIFNVEYFPVAICYHLKYTLYSVRRLHVLKRKFLIFIILSGISLWVASAIVRPGALPFTSNFNGIEVTMNLPPVRLVTHNGTPFTGKEWAGHYSYIYFGTSSCGTVCPRALGKLSRFRKVFPSEDVGFYFISLNPLKDRPEVMNRVVRNLGSNWTGLTAITPESLLQITRAFGVIADFGKLQQNDWKEDAVNLDHSSFIYLLDSSGNVRIVYPENDLNSDRMLDDLKKLIKIEKGV